MADQAESTHVVPNGKNIVICSDGTGNSVNKGRGTNVFKLFEAIDFSGHIDDPHLTRQIAFYDDGVGTERIALFRLLGGALGWGLARNVRQLYRELSRAYQPGDRIYMFGFSRGAFTVRTLISLICKCGLIDAKNPRPVKSLPFLEAGSENWLRWVAWRAWRAHRWSYRALLESIFLFPFKTSAKGAVEKFRRNYSVNYNGDELLPQIHFVGVWDTVGSVAIPFNALRVFLNNVVYRFSFPAKKLPHQVEKACHAIAIDEERHAFHPVLWDETDTGSVGVCRCDYTHHKDHAGTLAKQGERSTDPRVEQVWFPGVHSNVGGGYPKQGISLVALDWMMAKAEKHDLRFSELARRAIHQDRNVHDHLYNSRRGISLLYFYKPRNIFRLTTKQLPDRERGSFPSSRLGWIRWKIYTMQANQQTQAKLRVHASVLDRIVAGTQRYSPAPLPKQLTVVETPNENRRNLDKIPEKLAVQQPQSLSSSVMTRQVAQMALYLIAAVPVIVAVLRLGGFPNFLQELWNRMDEPHSIVWDAAKADPYLAGTLAVLLGIIWLVSRLTRARIQKKCRKYWRDTLS